MVGRRDVNLVLLVILFFIVLLLSVNTPAVDTAFDIAEPSRVFAPLEDDLLRQYRGSVRRPYRLTPRRQGPTSGEAVSVSFPLDLVIEDGTIVDGTGSPPYQADIAVVGDKIIAIADELKYEEAEEVIDAQGLMIAPGFINPHSHTDEGLYSDAASAVRQGITTAVGGQDGRSPLPLEEFFAKVESSGLSLNLAMLAGQGSLRTKVMSYSKAPAGPSQMRKMRELLREALEQGAFGLSTGLEYEPGSYTPLEEIESLLEVVAEYDGIYSTHLASEGDSLLESLQQALDMTRSADVPLEISHFKVVYRRNWPKGEEALTKVKKAREEGHQVMADVYPYRAPDYATNLELSRIHDYYRPEDLLIKKSAVEEWEGQTVAEVARGLVPDGSLREGVQEILREDPNTAVVALIVSAENLERFITAPFSVLCNDASAKPLYADHRAYRVHPRTYGAFPRLLRIYVREKGLLTWPQAIEKITRQPARFFGFEKRGMVQTGYYADLVLFDPKTVSDRATWTHPQRYPEGIDYVVINGRVVVEKGKFKSEVHAGRILKRERD